MPRQPRYFLPEIPQHVIARGVDKNPVFFGPQDYVHYLDDLRAAASAHGCDIHAYVLMTNHVHILLTPGHEKSLPLMMQAMGRTYVQRLNKRHRRTGTLWEGRYKACLVQNDRYLLTCQRYIELNPVRAGLARRPGDYPFSSFAANAYGAANSLLTRHPVYEALHADPVMRPKIYRHLFRDLFSAEELRLIRQRTNACSFLGDDRFKTTIESTLGRTLSTGARGRPARKSV
jgi:putative transposase